MKKTQKLIKCTSFALLFLFMLVGLVSVFPALDSLDGKTDIGETALAETLAINSISLEQGSIDQLYDQYQIPERDVALLKNGITSGVTSTWADATNPGMVIIAQAGNPARVVLKVTFATAVNINRVVLCDVMYHLGGGSWNGIDTIEWSTNGTSWNTPTINATKVSLTLTQGGTGNAGYYGNVPFTFAANEVTQLYIRLKSSGTNGGLGAGVGLTEIMVEGTFPVNSGEVAVPITSVSGTTNRYVNGTYTPDLRVLYDGNKQKYYRLSAADYDAWEANRITVNTYEGTKQYGGSGFNTNNGNTGGYYLCPNFGTKTVSAYYVGRQYYYWKGQATLTIDLGQVIDVSKIVLHGVINVNTAGWRGIKNIKVSSTANFTDNKVASVSATSSIANDAYVMNNAGSSGTSFAGEKVTINLGSYKTRYLYLTFAPDASSGYCGMSEIEVLGRCYEFDVREYIDSEYGYNSWDGTFKMSLSHIDIGLSYVKAVNYTDRYVDANGYVLSGATVALSDIKGGSPTGHATGSGAADIYSSDSRIFKGYYIHKGGDNIPGDNAAYNTVKSKMTAATSPGTINITMDAQVTVYLIYETVYNVTFDLAGGSGTTNARDYTWSETVLLNTPTKLGYRFDGWKCAFNPDQGDNNDYNGKIFNGGATLKNIAHRTAQKVTVTFTAQWSAVNYTLVYNFGDTQLGSKIYHATDYDATKTNYLTASNVSSKASDVSGITLSGAVFTYNGANYTYGHAKIGDTIVTEGTVSDDSSLVISLYYTPCYKVEVNGNGVIIEPLSNNGVTKVQDSDEKDYYSKDVQFKLKIKWDGIDESTMASKRLKATSVIKVNGQRVMPLTSVPQKYGDDYYILVEYKNGLEYVLNKSAAQYIETDGTSITVEADIAWEDNVGGTLINNFAPLGVTTNKDVLNGTYAEKTTMRFGTVWYIDDYAYQHTWVRNTNHATQPVGMILLQPRSALRNPTNNGYADYITATKDTNEWSNYLYYNCLVETGAWYGKNIPDDVLNADLTGEWEANKGIKKKGIEWMVESISDYIAWQNEQKSDKKVSFGGREISAAASYYYLKDEDGAKFIEYSMVLTGLTSDNSKNVHVMAFPYLSVLDGFDPTEHPDGFVPSDLVYNTYYYTYQAPIGAYTLNELIAALNK